MSGIVKGSIIREYKYGTFIECEVNSEPVVKGGKLEFTAVTTKNNTVVSEGRVIGYLKYESSLELVR